MPECSYMRNLRKVSHVSLPLIPVPVTASKGKITPYDELTPYWCLAACRLKNWRLLLGQIPYCFDWLTDRFQRWSRCCSSTWKLVCSVGWHAAQQGRSILRVTGRPQSDWSCQHLPWSSVLWCQAWISRTYHQSAGRGLSLAARLSASFAITLRQLTICSFT